MAARLAACLLPTSINLTLRGIFTAPTSIKNILTAVILLWYYACLITHRREKNDLPRDAMHKRGLCRHAVCVCLSVCHVRELCQNE